MKKLQLQNMSVDQLWALHEEVSQRLTSMILEEKQQLEQRLEQLSQSQLSITSNSGRRRRYYPKVYPKYQNPQIPEETWSGRGKRPRWLVKALAAGKKIDDFIIPDQSKEDDRALEDA
jgi:DNA-binding protein H-NS